ncbi:chitosanase [Georgenia thermotolerans]|uniref:Chitosanase n=1 Tax=Georgenia thermotolerans TaxID=527326 RepID=A0A7J5UK68_9MICO|nr:chitosanase [Georgenia thermotolerans]KAE8762661.1 chitosanase [Georgenia thermotolerans]
MDGRAEDPELARCKELALQMTSTAENSTLDWPTAYGYIEDIGDGRGYTGGLVGFCSGTGDMLALLRRYAERAPDNPLAPYLEALTAIMAAPYSRRPKLSHRLLDPGFVPAWRAAADDPAFRQAQRELRDEVYWDPALEAARADGVGPLGLAIYYDVSVNHGPGEDRESFGGILETARAACPTPAAGGDEARYLATVVDARAAVLKEWGDLQPDGRVAAHRALLATGNLRLAPPVSWSMYGDRFTVPA